MAAPKDGLLGPIAALLRRRRGARATDPEDLDQLRGILEAAPAALVAQGTDGQVLVWNRAAARLLGWSKLPADDPLPLLIPVDARADESALRQRVLAGNDVFRAPMRFLHADGEVLNLMVSAAPRRNAAGRIVGIVSLLEEAIVDGRVALVLPPRLPPEAASQDSVHMDMPTDRQSADRGNMPVRGTAQPSRLLAKVSHDLRQPLHALSLLTAALERRVKEPAARDLVNDAGAMVRALQATFDNLMDLGRLDEGLVQAHPTIVPVVEVLAPLAGEFAREAERRNITFRHVGSGAMIHTDAVLLQRLLRQLVINAVRFTAREDGARGKVLLGARRCGDALRLVVADDGIGVPVDQQATMFEPFVLSDAGRAAGGLGLGLAIAARLATLLGGEIKLHSQAGKGSRFWIDVPLQTMSR